MGKKREEKKKSGGLGKVVALMFVVVVVGVAGFWFLAPEQFREMTDSLKGLFSG